VHLFPRFKNLRWHRKPIFKVLLSSRPRPILKSGFMKIVLAWQARDRCGQQLDHAAVLKGTYLRP
jgi:hypothetical protein